MEDRVAPKYILPWLCSAGCFTFFWSEPFYDEDGHPYCSEECRKCGHWKDRDRRRQIEVKFREVIDYSREQGVSLEDLKTIVDESIDAYIWARDTKKKYEGEAK